jgi:hypothetical protein
MATTLEALEQRVAALEHQVAELRHASDDNGSMRPARPSYARLVAQWRTEKAQVQQRSEEVFTQMSIAGEAVPAEHLRAMLKSQGVDPKTLNLSGGIVEMREE